MKVKLLNDMLYAFQNQDLKDNLLLRKYIDIFINRQDELIPEIDSELAYIELLLGIILIQEIDSIHLEDIYSYLEFEDEEKYEQMEVLLKDQNKKMFLHLTNYISKANFKNNNITFSKLSFEDSQFFKTTLEKFIISSVSFSFCDFTEVIFENLYFDKKSVFLLCSMERAQFIDCQFDQSFVFSANVRNSVMRNVNFIGTNMSSSFENTIFDHCYFYFSDDERDTLSFSNCTFIKCAFSGNFADAKGISQDILEANIGAKDKIVLPKSLKIPMKWPRRLDLPSFWEWTESGKVREGKGNVDYM